MPTITQTPPQHALQKRDVSFYLCSAASSLASVDLLHALFCSRSASPETDAIWDGYWALNHQAEDSIAGLRDSGGLLFYGQPAALEAAKAVAA